MSRPVSVWPTERNREALEHIDAHIAQHGWAPTVRELAASMGLRAPQAAQQHIVALIRMGLLAGLANSPRALRITGEGYALLTGRGRAA